MGELPTPAALSDGAAAVAVGGTEASPDDVLGSLTAAGTVA